MRSEALLLLALTLPFAASGCGDGEARASDLVEQAKGGLEDLDLSESSTDALQAKVGELTRELGSRLGGVEDVASALEARKHVQPLLGQLGQLKETLGDRMPDLGPLKSLGVQLQSRFLSRPDVLDALKPILDKIRALTS